MENFFDATAIHYMPLIALTSSILNRNLDLEKKWVYEKSRPVTVRQRRPVVGYPDASDKTPALHASPGHRAQ